MWHPLRSLRETWHAALEENKYDYLERARQLEDEGRFDDAIKLIEALVRRHPDDLNLKWRFRWLKLQPELSRANAVQEAGRRDEARAIVSALQARTPDEPEIELWLGIAAAEKDEFELSVRHLRRAAALANGDPNTVFRAAFFARRGDLSVSRELLEQVKTLVAADSAWDFRLIDDLPHLEGLLAFDEGNAERGALYLERALELQTNDAVIAADLAEAYIALGDPSRAIAVIDEAFDRGIERLPRLLELRDRVRRDHED